MTTVVPAPIAQLPAERAGLPRWRRLVAAGLLVVGLPILTEILVQDRARLSYATPVLSVLSLVVVVCLVGGVLVAVPAAVIGGLVLNWFFTEPYDTLTITAPNQVVVLVVYLGIALAISVIVDLAARRSAQAARARAEAASLSSLAGATLAEAQTLPDLLERVRRTFGMRVVTLTVTTDAGAEQIVARTGGADPDGNDPAPEPDERVLRVAAGPEAVLVATGPPLFAADRRVITSFAEAAGTAYEGRQLAEQARRSAELAAADQMRTALLASVGHDLRTPLAGIKAAASSLLQPDVQLSAADRDELIETIDVSADRLQALIANLLDASRLQAGAVNVRRQPVSIDEALSAALGAMPADARRRVHVQLPTESPSASADPGLLDRVLANLIDNAVRHAPDSDVDVSARRTGGQVQIDIADHGPGVTGDHREQIFTPFQRLGDRDPNGVGLGLAVARGFAEAMSGALEATDTEGGGLTLRLTLPTA